MTWLVLAACVTAIDGARIAKGRPTLSAEYLTGLRAHPVPVLAGTGYIVAHLLHVLPARVDALRGLR